MKILFGKVVRVLWLSKTLQYYMTALATNKPVPGASKV